MNYNYSGQCGAPRRKAPPSMPYDTSARDSILSRSDFAPSERKGTAPAFANRTNNMNCHDKHTWGLKDHPLAMVYSPLQSFSNLYDEETALCRGTLFSELDLPFEGHKCGGGKDRCC